MTTRHRSAGLAAGALVLLVLSSGLVAPGASAQTATLRGFVSDRSDGQPLLGAAVLVQRVGAGGAAEGESQGSATDSDGLYVIPRLAPGRYLVRASYVGYLTAADTLRLDAGEVRSYDIALDPSAAELDEAVVESERTTGGARVTAGVQSIDPADVAMVPTPDVSGDLATYLTTTPGVVTTGDRGGQLFIRGGEPSQNLVLLDGMAIYQPFHVLGFYSAFPTDLLARADLYAGGYPARYGGQISSVLDVATRTGNKQELAASVSVAPFVSAAQLEGPLAQGSVSFLASGRLSVIEQGAARLVDQDLPFAFGDVFGKVHANVTPNAQLSVSGIHTYDRGTVGADVGGVVPEEVRWTNTAAGLRFLFLPGTFPLRAEILSSVSQLDASIGDAAEPSRASSIGRLAFDVNLTNYLGRADLHTGAFLRTNRLTSSLDFFGGGEDDDYFTEVGLYAQPEVRLGGGLALQAGLRLHSFPNDGRTYLEPRFRGVWAVGAHELSAAGGLYHQEIVGVNDRRDVANVFTAWTRAPAGEVASAWHAIAGYRVTPTGWLEFVAEGYYKALDGIAVAEWTAFPRFTTNLQPATGEVRGLDTRVEVRRGPWYAYVGYGLSDVVYDAKGEVLELWYGEETLRFHPPHDRRHQVNALLSTTLYGFELAARWQFGSGLPFTRALGFDTFINPSGPIDVFDDAGTPRVIYERPFNGRLPTYHRLDLSVERTFDLGPAALTGQFALINAYDRANLFYYDTFTLRRVDQLPIVPSFGLKLAYN